MHTLLSFCLLCFTFCLPRSSLGDLIVLSRAWLPSIGHPVVSYHELTRMAQRPASSASAVSVSCRHCLEFSGFLSHRTHSITWLWVPGWSVAVGSRCWCSPRNTWNKLSQPEKLSPFRLVVTALRLYATFLLLYLKFQKCKPKARGEQELCITVGLFAESLLIYDCPIIVWVCSCIFFFNRWEVYVAKFSDKQQEYLAAVHNVIRALLATREMAEDWHNILFEMSLGFSVRTWWLWNSHSCPFQACHEQGVISHFLTRSLQRLGDERSSDLLNLHNALLSAASAQ